MVDFSYSPEDEELIRAYRWAVNKDGYTERINKNSRYSREVEKYKEYHRRLLTIKPGITGLAQISGRSDLDFEDEYKLDIYYIENWSLWMDIQICFKTLGVLFRRRKNNR